MDAPDRDEHSMKSCGVAEKSLSMARAEQVCVKTVFPGNGVFFLISLALHTAALAALWFLAVPAAGMGQGEGAGGYITVSLLPGPPGDSGSGESSASSPDAADGASASAPATADRAVEPSAAPPATDTIHAADIDPKRPDAAPAEPVPPVPAAIPVRKIKDEQKAKPKNRKAERTAVEKAAPEHARRTLDDRGQKSGRASAAGREQTGTAGGRGGQGGEKGGAGGCCGRNDRQHHRNGCLDSRHRNDLEYDRKYRFDRDGYLDFGQQYLRQLFHRSDGRRTKSVLHDRSQRQ